LDLPHWDAERHSFSNLALGFDQVANAGLDYLHNNFEFIRNGEAMTMQKAMDVCSTAHTCCRPYASRTLHSYSSSDASSLQSIKDSFQTGFIQGKQPRPAKFELEIPYKDKVLKVRPDPPPRPRPRASLASSAC
jgi:hypothetical protein